MPKHNNAQTFAELLRPRASKSPEFLSHLCVLVLDVANKCVCISRAIQYRWRDIPETNAGLSALRLKLRVLPSMFCTTQQNTVFAVFYGRDRQYTPF